MSEDKDFKTQVMEQICGMQKAFQEVFEAAPNHDPRPSGCSCHPDDRPPECQREHGTTHCQLAWSRKELTRLRKENEILRGALEPFANTAGRIEMEDLRKARSALEGLGCQANAMQVGEAVSQAEPALHLDVGGEAGSWFALPPGSHLETRCATEGCYSGAAYRLEATGIGSNYCSGCRAKIAAISPRQDEEPLAAMSAHREHIVSLTPIKNHENPPRTAEDQSTAIAQPPEPFGRQ